MPRAGPRIRRGSEGLPKFWGICIALRQEPTRTHDAVPSDRYNLDMDAGGFIYATVMDDVVDDDANPKDDKVRRLNAKGEDLLIREGFHGIIGDVEYASIHTLAANRGQSVLIDVVAHDYGTYSVLDSIRSRIYTYDSTGKLLHMFGYRGLEKGQVAKASAIAAIDRNILVLDSQLRRITIYRPTDYGMLIWAALDSYSRGDYAQTEAIWRQVLELNSNCDFAYTGIGRALFRRGEYAEAMKNFKLGKNREYYDAFELYRRDVIYNNLSLFMGVLFGVIILAYILARLVGRARALSRTAARPPAPPPGTGPSSDVAGRGAGCKVLPEDSRELKFALYVIFHPLDGFWELLPSQGSVASATIILAVVCLVTVCRGCSPASFSTGSI